MPERWQRKLKELRRVSVPEASWEQIRRSRPKEAPARSGRQRLVAGTVGLGLFLAIAVAAWSLLLSAPKEPTQGADVLRVRCDESGTQVLTPEVRAHPDGIHAEVEYDPTQAWVLQIDLASAITPWNDGYLTWDLPIGGSGTARDVLAGPAPGPSRLVCAAPEGDRVVVTEGAWVPFVVTDTEGAFVPYAPSCSPIDTVDLKRGPREAPPADPDPVAFVRSIPGVLPTDVVEPAGYPKHESTRVWLWMRVVRDGQIVAAARLHVPTLSVVAGAACSSSSIDWASRNSHD
jgi:hypothetical protein